MNNISAMNDLANAYKENGEKQKALVFHEKEYELNKELFGENHPDTIKAMEILEAVREETDEKQ